jgi:hypothetical protein
MGEWKFIFDPKCQTPQVAPSHLALLAALLRARCSAVLPGTTTFFAARVAREAPKKYTEAAPVSRNGIRPPSVSHYPQTL